MSRPLLRSTLVVSAAAALLLAGCASAAPTGASTSEPPASGASGAAAATIADGDLVTPGKLTIATGTTAYFPYVIDDDPTSGEGFEAAVAYAVAEKLGFAAEDVEWVRTSFEAAIAPGPKSFDFNIQQYTITDEREQAVDFSTPYYAASQAVVAIEGGAADGVDTLAGLKDLTIGVMAASTSETTANEAIAPNVPVQAFPSNDEAVAALQAGQVDAIVLDLPTAYYATGVYIENSFIVGELPAAGVPDEWGLLLSNDSPLTAPVSAAVDELRADGTLDEITDEWLGSGQGVTLLQ